MKIILKKIGGMSEEDFSFIEDECSVEYLKTLPESTFKKSTIYDGLQSIVGKDWCVLLKNMLEFNPFFRHSARELLQSPLFDDIRCVEMERQ